MILRALRENDIAPPRLKLEITESAIILDPAAATEKLRRLKEIGVLLAVDDFGTGYSSLSYLRQFPMDILKIDRSFISGTDTPKENAEIVRSIVDMAHSMASESPPKALPPSMSTLPSQIVVSTQERPAL